MLRCRSKESEGNRKECYGHQQAAINKNPHWTRHTHNREKSHFFSMLRGRQCL